MYELKLSSSQMVYGYSATKEQLEEYGRRWRECYMTYGKHTAGVYLGAIDALRETLRDMERIMPSLAK